MIDKVDTKVSSGILIAGMLIAFVIFFGGRNTVSDTEALPIQETLESLSVEEFKERIVDEEVVILDVRTPEEYQTGYITGALNIDFYDPALTAKLGQLDKSKSYAIYCRTGNRSGQMLALMREQGFKHVVNLAGGIVAWTGKSMAVCTTERVCMR